MAAAPDQKDPHIPVLIGPLIAAAGPIAGTWLDGTFGAGGYARALLEAGADKVIGVDQDPAVFDMAADWAPEFGDRLELQRGNFAQLDAFGENLQGVVLDLGVSSMQLDQAERGFSFMRDGPLDMRMSQEGPSAADLVNRAEQDALADILFQYGEERASRRIARAIVKAREEGPITTTLALAKIIEGAMPRGKPGTIHPATRSFQGLRIAVNDELGVLHQGLAAAERALGPGGVLAVVTFHSLEDRVVKRFPQIRSGRGGNTSRHLPEVEAEPQGFELIERRAVTASDEETRANPRARSAKLRLARRLDAPPEPVDPERLGLPSLTLRENR